jgi:hypothetical protein
MFLTGELALATFHSSIFIRQFRKNHSVPKAKGPSPALAMGPVS